MRRYGFRVKLEATVTVSAGQVADARDALGGSLGGATARVLSSAGMGLELSDIEMSGSATLLLVDGIDPTASLMTVLSDWRADRALNRSGTKR